MTDLDTTIANLRERLRASSDDIVREFSSLFAELDLARSAADQLKSVETDKDQRLKRLEESAEEQGELIASLTQEAEEARALRGEVSERELEIERTASELESKNDLVTAMRRQLEGAEELKTAAKQSDKKIFEQQNELDRMQKELYRSERELIELKEVLEAVNERAADESVVENTELVALKAELDERKTMITSLRKNAEKAGALEARLEAKCEAVDAFEETISELRRSVEGWRSKYQAAKGEDLADVGHTVTELPVLTNTEVNVLKKLENLSEEGTGQTVAIDMRAALKEALEDKTRAKS